MTPTNQWTGRTWTCWPVRGQNGHVADTRAEAIASALIAAWGAE